MQPHSLGGRGTGDSNDNSQGHPAGPLHKDNKAGPGWVQGQECRVTCQIAQARDFIQYMMQLLGEAGTVSHVASHSSCSAALFPAAWDHNCAISGLS